MLCTSMLLISFLSVFSCSIGDAVEANKYILVKAKKYKLGRLLSMSEVGVGEALSK